MQEIIDRDDLIAALRANVAGKQELIEAQVAEILRLRAALDTVGADNEFMADYMEVAP